MIEKRQDPVLSGTESPVDVAVATIGADHFEDVDFVHALEVLPQLGICHAELMCWHPRNLTPDGLLRNRRRFQEAGLNPVSMHFRPFRGTGDIHPPTELGSFLWALNACRMLGAKILKFGGPGRDWHDALRKAIEILGFVTPVAEDMGISLVVENRFQSAFEYPEDYEKIFSAISSPNIGICMDMGHFAASGVDMVALVDKMPEKIHHIDIKDCRVVGSADFVRFGTGVVPFDEVVPRAIEKGFSGYLIVELPRISEDTMVRDLREGVEIAKRYVRPLSRRAKYPRNQ